MPELCGESVSSRKAYNDGYQAYHYGFSIKKCPFRWAELISHWKHGWRDAYAADEDEKRKILGE